MQNKRLGTLYVVATPIGNLQDITFRAIAILKQVDKIAAEDTRHASKLLTHYEVSKPLLSLHNFNEREKQAALVEELLAGCDMALISDAGTPLINDPGYALVRACVEKGVTVVPIPGACAAIAALSAAGLPTDKFSFQGFLPAKASQRQAHLKQLIHLQETVIFYEAPHRLQEALSDIAVTLGDSREVVIAREMTKLYESFVRGSAKEVSDHFKKHPDQVRGEIVLLIKGGAESAPNTDQAESILKLLLAELPVKKAVSLANALTGERKNWLYEKALALKNNLD